MMHSQQYCKVISLLAIVIATATALPYRAYQPEGIPSRGVHPIPSGMDDYLSSYLQAAQQQQLLNNRQNQYLYQQGYVQEQPPNVYAEALAAILPYLNTEETVDYSNYDYNNYNNYNNDDGIWYDDVATPQEIANEKRTKDQLALAQLYIDSLNGKYSVEDLETLVKEAMYEDNTENQLHQLMQKKINKKKSIIPVLGTRPAGGRFTQRKGQKEEALMVPATSVRRPVFAHEVEKPEEKKDVKHPAVYGIDTSNSGTDTNKSQETYLYKDSLYDPQDTQEFHSPSSSDNSEVSAHKSEDDSSSSADKTTMRPYMKSAYEIFKEFLERERQLRQAEDEASMPQKRFVSDPENLTKQLTSLKKKNRD